MFQTVLDAAGAPAGTRRRLRTPLGLAIALHGAAAALILGARIWTLEEAPEPPVRIQFFDFAPPPLEGDGDESAPRPAPPSPDADEQARLTLPARAPDAPALDPETPPDRTQRSSVDRPNGGNAPEADGRDASDGAGDGNAGVPGGSRDGVPNGTGDRPGATRILIPGGDVHPPMLVLRVDPVYPETARRLHLEGTVLLEAVISGSGLVEDIRVVKSVHPILDAAAVHAVEQWRYRPATLKGRAVRVYLTVSVTFGLH